MSLDTYRCIASAALQGSFDRVVFAYHGGEPTLVPLSWYASALDIQESLNRDGVEVVNVLQTNATRLDARWARFLRDNGISVSVSVDGMESVHDCSRPTASGLGSWNRVLAGLDVLRSHGVHAGLLVVVGQALAREPARNLWRSVVDIGAGTVDFLPVRGQRLFLGVGSEPETVAPESADHDVYAMLGKLFDIWLSSQSTMRVSLFESTIARLRGLEPEICVLGGSCFQEVLSVESDGSFGLCDILSGDEIFLLGRTPPADFISAIDGASSARARQWNVQRIDGLASCPWRSVCRGGCPHSGPMGGGVTSSCCGYAPFIEHVARRLGQSIDIVGSGGATPVAVRMGVRHVQP